MPAAAPVMRATFPLSSMSNYLVLENAPRPEATAFTTAFVVVRSRRKLRTAGGAVSPVFSLVPPPVVNIRTIALHSRLPVDSGLL